MNVYIKIFLWSIVMILGLSALFMSVMVFSIGRADGVVFAWVTLAIGIIFGPLGLYQVVSLNNQFKKERLEELLKQPEKILLRFTDEKGKEVIISEDELFLGLSHYPFRVFYESLENLRIKENILYFDMQVRSSGRTFNRTVKVEIPSNLLAEIPKIFEFLKEKYALFNSPSSYCFLMKSCSLIIL